MVIESNTNLQSMQSDDMLSHSSNGRSSHVNSDAQNSARETKRMIMVANFLPIHSLKNETTGQWSFSWDEDSLLLQMKDGFSSDTKVIYVGSLMVDIDVSEQERVAQKLWQDHRCIPTFFHRDLQDKFYHGFCKGQLWPLFHYSLPFTAKDGDLFDRSLFQAYVSANTIFAEKVIEVITPDDDQVWVHDYHLMLLPILLRKKLSQVKLGIFLYSPFPSSEVYKALPVREEILKGLLNADVIGFHTFDYARHFLSCCSRLLGLDHELKHGSLGINYYGRTVRIKILPVGVHVGHIQSVMNLPCTVAKVQEIEKKFKGKKLFLGVDYMEAFKGIGLKLLALELLLKKNQDLRGKLVLVQIANPARSSGKGVMEARCEAMSIAERINNTYGSPGYEPVVFIEHSIPFYERVAFYAVAECCIVNALREGMNLVPYEYVVCRQGTEMLDKVNGFANTLPSPCASTLIVSEFVGCSLSLSGTFRVNPWSVEDVANAMWLAEGMSETEKKFRHEKHYNYVSSHQLTYWACSFAQDLRKACEDNYNRRCCTLGFGLDVKVVALSPSFNELSVDETVSFYKRANRRAIFLDYDGTIMPEFCRDKTPSAEIVSLLNTLCGDPNNTVFIVSGRSRTSLGEWFSSCEKLGIAAEHGYFIRCVPLISHLCLSSI